MEGIIWNRPLSPSFVCPENARACDWLSKADYKDVMEEIKGYFLENTTEHLPEIDYHSDYVPCDIIKHLLRISASGSHEIPGWKGTKDKVEKACCELLDEFSMNYNNMETESPQTTCYLYNLAALITTLQCEGDVLKKSSESAFVNMYNLAASGDFAGKKAYYNSDLQAELLGDITSYETHERWKEKVHELCERWFDNPKYTAICYRKLWELNPDEAVLRLGDFLAITGLRGLANLYSVERWLSEDWAKNVIEKKLPFLVNEVLPVIFETGLANRLKHLDLIRDECGIDVPEPVATNFMMPDGREETVYVMKPEIRIKSEKIVAKKNGIWIKENRNDMIRGEELTRLLDYEAVQRLGRVYDRQNVGYIP